MNDGPILPVAARRQALEQALDRRAVEPDPEAGPLSHSEREHLIEEGVELFWNDLEWEAITGEEQVDGEPLVGLIFPGFLAFIRGLLLREVMPDALDRARPRPQVVETLLGFLEARVEEFQSEVDASGHVGERARAALPAIDELLDQVLYLLYDVTPEEKERLATSLRLT